MARQTGADEAIARALQAQEYHRTRHPSYQKHPRAPSHPSDEWADRQLLRDEQLRMALEVNPEAFVHVKMLYVPCTLNNVATRAFVDTGAQMTVRFNPCYTTSLSRQLV